jgi:hypothetical protein
LKHLLLLFSFSLFIFFPPAAVNLPVAYHQQQKRASIGIWCDRSSSRRSTINMASAELVLLRTLTKFLGGSIRGCCLLFIFNTANPQFLLLLLLTGTLFTGGKENA